MSAMNGCSRVEALGRGDKQGLRKEKRRKEKGEIKTKRIRS